MARQSSPATKINPRIPCATCNKPTYVLTSEATPECCECLEKRLGKMHDAPDIEIRAGRIYWTKI